MRRRDPKATAARRLARRRASSAVLLGCASILALAVRANAQAVLPQGGTVASGQVRIGMPAGNALTINQTSSRAVVDWNSFSVGPNASVNFVQPNAGAAILNRVTGTTSSTIAGQITATGQVFLVNPNGIAITPSGSVQVGGGFVASTLDISNADFNAGNLNFAGRGASAAVSNAGNISGAAGSFIGLIGGSVSNSGTINVPFGRVGLGAGEKVTLNPGGDGFLQVALPTGATTADGHALIDVAGRVRAAGGTVEIKAATAQRAIHDVVRVSGSVSARSISGRSGHIVLDGGSGAVTVSGTLAADGGKRNRGGTVIVTGDEVALTSTARVTADGSSGGSVLIGGDLHGGADSSVNLVDTPVRTATTTSVADGARISANGSLGDGGNVVIWSNSLTNFRGAIAASGGSAGQGGAVEVSSHGVLGFGGSVDVTAKSGKTGTLLLDPFDVTISAGSDTSIANGGNTFTPTGNSSILSVGTLQAALATANVTVSTGGGGAQSGNITVADALTWSSANSLTLNAAGAIAINAPITASSGALTLSAGSPFAAITATGAISVGSLTISQGAWSQNTANLPGLYAGSFSIGSNASFLRAAGGSGTAGSPYLLTDIYGVQGIGSSAAYLAGSYKMINDIDASTTAAWNGGLGFNPIGSNGFPAAGYTGTFDGNNYAISNLFINRGATATGVGMFGYTSGATIQNVDLLNANVTGGSGGTNGNGAGTLVGIADNSSTIQNVSVTGTMTGSNAAGNNANIGGIVGELSNNSTLTNASAGVNVTSAIASVGGAVGAVDSGGIVQQVSATGAVSAPGQSYVGGLVGWAGGTITDSYATGAVSGGSSVGGFAGASFGGSISNSYSTGLVTGGNGFIGSSFFFFFFGTVSNSYWNTETSGQASGGDPGATGLTTAQMLSQASFAGFDFAGTWYQTAGYYPTLRGTTTILGAAPGATGGDLTVSSAADTVLTSVTTTTNINTTSLQNLLGVGNVLVSTTSGTLAVNNDVTWGGSSLRLASSGALTIAANFTSGSGGNLGLTSSAISVSGNAINLGGALTAMATASGAGAAVSLSNATISVGSGSSMINGTSSTGYGVNFTGSSSLTAGGGGTLTVGGTNTGSTVLAATLLSTNANLTTAGSVTLNGTSTSFVGLLLNGGNTVTATSGSLAVNGSAISDAGLQLRGTVGLTNSGATTFSFTGNTSTYRGLELLGLASTDVTVSGNASFSGISDTGTGVIFGTSSTFNVASGNVSVSGLSSTASGTGAAIGTRFADASVSNSGGGSLAITGTSNDAAGTVNIGSAGILATGATSLTNSGGGSLSLSGTNTSGYGTELGTSAALATSGTMSISGSSSAGYGFFMGIASSVAASSGNLTLSGTSASNIAMRLRGTSVTNNGAGTLALNAAGDTDLQVSIASSGGPLILSETGTLTQAAGTITAGSLLLSGTGAFALNAPGNSIGTIAANVGSLAVTDGSALTVGTVAGTSGITASSSATLITSGDLTIASGAPISAASPVLATSGAFVNNAGNAAVTATSGRWLIYSSAPGADTLGGLDSGNTAIWNATSATLPPGSVSAVGNRYLFANQPTLTLTSTNAIKTYGTDATAAIVSDYSVSGYQSGVSNAFLGDNAASTFTGGPSVTSTGATATASVASSPYAMTIAQASLVAISGYALAFNSSGTLTVNPAPVTVTALGGFSTYGSSPANPGLSATGLQNGQGVNVLTGLSNSFGISNATNAGSYVLSVIGALTNSNYTVVGTNSGSWMVNPAPVTVTALGGSSTYGSSPANPGLSAAGLQNGQSVNVLTGLSNSFGIINTTNAGSYVLSVIGALTNSNYTVVGTNTGGWTVNPAPVTVTAVGGSSTYGSSPANPGLSAVGLQNGQGVNVLTGLSNSFGISNATNAGSYVLNVIGALTNSNYTVVGTNTGGWTVNPAPVTVTALGGSSIFGSSPSNPGLFATGLQNGQGVDVLTGLYNAFGITSASKIGSYALGVGGSLTNGNYTVAKTVPGTWTVTDLRGSVTGGTNLPNGSSPTNGPSPSNPNQFVAPPSANGGTGALSGLNGATQNVNTANEPVAAAQGARDASADPSRAALEAGPPAPLASPLQPTPSLSTSPASVNVAPMTSANASPATQGDCGGKATGGGPDGSIALVPGTSPGNSMAGCAPQAAPTKAAGVIDFALSQLNRDALLEAVSQEFVEVAQAKAVPHQIFMVSLAGASIALTAGLVGWFLRGGALLSALLSSMPLWRGFDPLVVVMQPRRNEGRGSATSEVDAMFEAAHTSSYSSRGTPP